MKKLLRLYFQTSLILRILGGFLIGSLIGVLFWYLSRSGEATISQAVLP